MAEKRCVYKCGAWNCGSYQFNLYKDDIDQGELCDVHYWQTKAQPAQEAVAWRFKDPKDGHWLYTTHVVDLSKKYWRLKNEVFEPLYTAPPAAQLEQSLDDLVAEFESTPAGTESMRQGREWLKDLQLEQEPVGYVYWSKGHAVGAIDVQNMKPGTPLYTTPPAAQPCPTCEALARTVMLDQTSHDRPRPWQGLTEDDRFEIAAAEAGWEDLLIAAEAKLKEKNT